MLDLIAQNGGRPITDLESLQLAIMDSAYSPPSQMLGRVNYKPPREPNRPAQILSPIQDPNVAWLRIFGNWDPGAGGGGGGGGAVEPTEAQLRMAQRRLMLKYAKGQFGSVKGRVRDLYGAGTADRLQAHADFLNDLENSLPMFQRDPGGGGGSTGSTGGGSVNLNPQCVVPSRDSVPRKPATPSGWYSVLSENMPKLMQLAIACGRTRFVTLQIEDSGHPSVHGWHHDNRKNDTILFHTDMGNKFADALAKLKAIPTPDGRNMLYHSIVLWCGELSSGWTHGTNGLNWMVAGQAGGTWADKTGRLTRYDGQPHARLFLSIARAMGARFTTFGDPRVTPMSPLPDL